MLHVKNFSFSFSAAERPALQHIAFGLEEGDYLSIIGPNGAGKSTLLKCLMRLHEYGRTSGKIVLKGRDLQDYGQRELARVAAYVPQAGGRIPPFTVEELLRLSRYPHSPSAPGLNAQDREAVAFALGLTRMEGLARRPLKSLSGGERQKAFVAAALAQKTAILLLDEPASFLDPKHAADLNQLLKTLNQEHGLTLLTVTHDLNHPQTMGGKALVLREGSQLFFGTASELPQSGLLEAAYQHEFLYMQHPRSGKTLILAE
jgi:iron complex transport system ATP-binding protein